MSRTITGKTQTRRPNRQPQNHMPARAVGNQPVRSKKWRCQQCTFLNEGDQCNMCGSQKPPQRKIEEQKRNIHPRKPGKKPPQQQHKPSPQPQSRVRTLADLRPEQSKEKKIDGKRDLIGMLQDQASDKPLPCMRKK